MVHIQKKFLLLGIMLTLSSGNVYSSGLNFLRYFRLPSFYLPFLSRSHFSNARALINNSVPSSLQEIPGRIASFPGGSVIFSLAATGGLWCLCAPFGVNPVFLAVGVGAYNLIERQGTNRLVNQHRNETAQGFKKNEKNIADFKKETQANFDKAEVSAQQRHNTTQRKLHVMEQQQWQHAQQNVQQHQHTQQQVAANQIVLSTMQQDQKILQQNVKDTQNQLKTLTIKTSENFEQQKNQIENVQEAVRQNHQENQARFIEVTTKLTNIHDAIEVVALKQDDMQDALLKQQTEAKDHLVAINLQLEELKKGSKAQAQTSEKRHNVVTATLNTITESIVAIKNVMIGEQRHKVSIPSIESKHAILAAAMVKKVSDEQTQSGNVDDLD